MTEYEKRLDTWQWRNRAFQIKKRDDFTCQGAGCHARDHLEVHHLKYTTIFPWDEPGCNLITLCDRCHHAAGREKFHGSMPDQVKPLLEGLIKTVDKYENHDRLEATLEWARQVREASL